MIVWSAMSLIVGRSFWRRHRQHERVARRAAVRVRHRDRDRGRPEWFAAGVTVTVRLAPVPPNTMFAFGTRAVFDELPVTIRLAAAVSTSPTVKASAPVVAVLVDRLVGDVADRRQDVQRRDRQQERVARRRCPRPSPSR